MTQETQTLPGGTVIQGTNGARYIVEELLGTGGFSAVYRIQDRRTKRVFALKEIINAYDRDRRHLIIEAQLLKRQQHPALPKVYQVFEDVKRNRIYLLMDYIEGKDLETLRRERPEQRFSLAVALTLMAPIVDAICYLHRQRPPIIHRDVKPANIIVPSGAGKPYLVDFGLAKEYTEDKTTNIFRYGTPGYAAPEQYGQGTNLSTDIYGLGATFYTILTGQVPPDALARSLNKEQDDPLQAADQIYATIPGSVAAVLERAMRLHYAERFASVEEFWRELNAATPHHIREHAQLLRPLPTTTSTSTETNNAPAHPLKQPAAQSAHQAPPSPPTMYAQVRPVVQVPIHKMLFPILLTLILVGAMISGALVYRTWTYQHSYAANLTATTRVSPQRVPTPTATQTLPCAPASSSPPTATAPYPTLETCYMGTIYDVATNTHTALYLTNIQQKQDVIIGNFWGLGHVGTFNGTVTTDGGVAFKVVLQKLGVTLSFQGTIKLGGDITGIFDTLASDTQQNMGESGNWYLCTVNSALCYQSTPSHLPQIPLLPTPPNS